MVLSNSLEAEKIFKSYKGSYFHMMRDGELHKYEKFNVSKKTETVWLKELQSEALSALQTTTNKKLTAQYFSEYMDAVVHLKDQDGIFNMMNYLKETYLDLDSNTVLRCINSIQNSIKVIANKKLEAEIITECVNLLKEITQHPITISDDYKENGALPDYLTVDKVKADLARNITYWECNK